MFKSETLSSPGLMDTSPVSGGGQTCTYNAAGWVSDTAGPSGSFSLEYDGDGQEVQRLEGGTSTYYVRSTAMGGRKISEVNAAGQKLRTYVYADGQTLARQGENGGVKFEHTDPASTSVRKTNSSGTETARMELDPLGWRRRRARPVHLRHFRTPEVHTGFPGIR